MARRVPSRASERESSELPRPSDRKSRAVPRVDEHDEREHACRAWQLLVRFFFAQREYLPSFGEEFDLSPVQCHVLHLIEPERPLPMGRLAETLGCDASNVTGLVDRLEARGLLQRRPSAEDRRVKVIQLTATGSRVRGQLLRQITGGASCRLSRLSAEDQRSLVRILEGLIDDR